MAQKRMFDKSVIRRDEFIEMPDSTQNLYFHLSMDADDDGFVDNWKSIMRMTGKKEDDMKLLVAKNFVIPFDTGVIVIKHWRLNNYLRKDRYTETKYLEEKSSLTIGENEEYSLGRPIGIPDGNPDKNSIDKNSIDNIYSLDKIKTIIDYINLKLNSDYKYTTKKTSSLIKARIHEGFDIDDFKKVIDTKYNEWHEDIKFKQYLRPETLFGTKFESYLNQKTTTTTKNPEWFKKDIQKEVVSKEEEEELKELMKGYK